MFSSECVLCVLLIETYNRTIIFAGNQSKYSGEAGTIIPNSEFRIPNYELIRHNYVK